MPCRVWVLSRSASGRLKLHWCLMLHDVCVNKASTRWQEPKSPINKVPRLSCCERGISILSRCYLCVYIGLFTYLLKWIHVYFFSKLIIIQCRGRRVSTVSKRWIKVSDEVDYCVCRLLFVSSEVQIMLLFRNPTHAASGSCEDRSLPHTHFSGCLQ